MRKEPQPNEIYRHFKGNLYRIITLARHSETGEEMVVYQALYGDYQAYVRPLSMFMSEIDREKYPDVRQQYRFELIPQIIGADTAQVQPEPGARQGQPVQPEPGARQGQPEKAPEEGDLLDPRLLQFLDAQTYHERLNLLAAMHPDVTDEMINTMAVALDLEVAEGDIEERYTALKNCLLMMEKYECSRLR